jgi:hypothetical protein
MAFIFMLLLAGTAGIRMVAGSLSIPLIVEIFYLLVFRVDVGTDTFAYKTYFF